MHNDDNRWQTIFIEYFLYVYGNRQAVDGHGKDRESAAMHAHASRSLKNEWTDADGVGGRSEWTTDGARRLNATGPTDLISVCRNAAHSLHPSIPVIAQLHSRPQNCPLRDCTRLANANGPSWSHPLSTSRVRRPLIKPTDSICE